MTVWLAQRLYIHLCGKLDVNFSSEMLIDQLSSGSVTGPGDPK